MTDDVMILDNDIYAIFMDVFDTPHESDEALQEFLEELHQLNDEMISAMTIGDFNCLQRNAHKAKNTAGTIGMAQLARLAMIIDNHCRAEEFSQADALFKTQWGHTFIIGLEAINQIRSSAPTTS